MNTICPDCRKSISKSEVAAHLRAHDRANELGHAYDRLTAMSDDEVARLAELAKTDPRAVARALRPRRGGAR